MNSKKNLLDHSKAKVKLYERYLSIYLNVLSRSPLKNIYLYDLFCGEGKYEDNEIGSPLSALECIKNHYYANGQKCPNITIMFNDSGISEIDPGKLKVDRVKEFAEKIFQPNNVKINYTQLDYKVLIEKVIAQTNGMHSSERALLFIDPWGYKEIDPNDLKKLMSNGKTEVLLFLPISFMARFAQASKDINFKGGGALRKNLGTLFGTIDNLPNHKNQNEFIYLLREQFKVFLEIPYVDTYEIERDDHNLFALFFFTNSKKGFIKMLESKWSLDTEQGKGFSPKGKDNFIIFDNTDTSGYEDKVFKYLQSNNSLTNDDLLNFGLQHRFLPKHTKAVLDKLKKEPNIDIEVIPLDNKPARGYYLGNEERLVNIKLK